jgi:hypothetical protein
MPAPIRVSGTKRNMPTPANRPRKRTRLVNLKANRGANQGAPASDAINVYPFPFQGLFKPARHGHYPVFGVGLARRVGAWRAAGPGTLGGRHQRSGRFQ